MTYLDSFISAANSALDSDLPEELLPLAITNQAALLAGWDAAHWGDTTWG